MLQVDEIIRRVKTYQPAADSDIIKRAYDYSFRMHSGQMRKSGDPYFVHPASVAGIITDLRLDTASVCAGLLHDVVEDTLASSKDIEREFGGEIASLVDGVTKLSQINFTSKEDRQAENFRKMVVAMARDIRVLLVKLCDRVDNMRTLEFMKPESQERIARETMEIYAPLANRLGMAGFKSELEDLSFRWLEPDAYHELSGAVTRTKRERDKYISDVCKTLSSRLAEQGFAADVTGRAKHLYSIWRKMQSQECGLEQIHDMIAFRVLVESVGDCYASLGVIHSKWTPVPGRFKDYIALPKPNMYQSLHTTVIGPGRERVEIQIRTHEMHRVAERGIAAHWKYKERHSGGVADSDAQPVRVAPSVDGVAKRDEGPGRVPRRGQGRSLPGRGVRFTPKGDVRVFPRGATPVDFAFAIHTDVGLHVSRRAGERQDRAPALQAAQRRHRRRHHQRDAAAEQGLARVRRHHAGQVEDPKPPAARAADKSLRLGRELLERELHRSGVSLSEVAEERQRAAAGDRGAEGHLGRRAVHRHRLREAVTRGGARRHRAEGRGARQRSAGEPARRSHRGPGPQGHQARRDGIRLNGIDDVLVRYAKCCNPLPGDDILGFITAAAASPFTAAAVPRPSTPIPSGGWRSPGPRRRRSTAPCSCAW